ncbi:MAG: Crp/Fnr family transcriptional regulator [Desulfatibacillaceae bacterium]
MELARTAVADPSATIRQCLAATHLFDELSPEQRDIVARYVILQEVAEGELVFEEGRKGDYMCFVAKGQLAVLKNSSDGSDCAEICRVGPGNSMGEMAVIDNSPRSATVIARQDTLLLTLPSDHFLRIQKEHPQVGIGVLRGIARTLSRNLRQTSDELVEHMLPVI